MFCSIRWPETGGAPVCPHCGCPTCWRCPRPNGAPRFRCSACRRDFSPTSGTLFAFHKLEIRDYLAAVVIFCDEVKGKAALALSRDLDVQYKTAFVLAHKIREAMASEVKSLRLGGVGRHVEVDGCYVGGHVRPANRKEDRKDRRLAETRSGRRQVVVVIRERALPAWAAPCRPCSRARMRLPASSATVFGSKGTVARGCSASRRALTRARPAGGCGLDPSAPPVNGLSKRSAPSADRFVAQAGCSCQVASAATMALRRTTSLRMQAASATLGGLPRPTRRR
jgi:transposase-like protein